jgi:hypothetical protein
VGGNAKGHRYNDKVFNNVLPVINKGRKNCKLIVFSVSACASGLAGLSRNNLIAKPKEYGKKRQTRDNQVRTLKKPITCWSSRPTVNFLLPIVIRSYVG